VFATTGNYLEKGDLVAVSEQKWVTSSISAEIRISVAVCLQEGSVPMTWAA